MPKSVYIHIPFCHHICPYCDFNKVVLEGQPVEKYLLALEQEIKHTFARHAPDQVDTIFIGGGTPTALNPNQMLQLMDIIREHVQPWHVDLEYTMEANPGSVNRELLRVMKDGGVNRLSFGVQSFNEQLLKTLGRIHDARDVGQSIQMAADAGFDNMSIDLMFGLPGQTIEHVEHSLLRTLELPLKHVSAYSLKVEEGTHFYTLQKKGQLPLPHEDDELVMFERMIDTLSSNGFDHYEVSNFARPGYQSNHNLTYWLNNEYYGFGAGAHGYVQGVRHENAGSLQEYIDMVRKQGLPYIYTQAVPSDESMENMMIMGLRLSVGVSVDTFEQRFGESIENRYGKQLAQLQEKGLLTYEAKHYKLTRQGLYFGNDVFVAFIND